MEESRGCKFLNFPPRSTPVWSSGEALLFHCPESELDGETLYWLELANVMGAPSGASPLEMIALDYEALKVIENERRKLYVNTTE